MSRLQIIHTADLHGTLTQDRARRLRDLREQHGAVLLDSGDAISAGNVTFRRGPEPVLLQMNAAGYAAMALGNREYFFRRRFLLHKTAAAGFPLVCANLRAKQGDLRPILPSVVLDTPAGRLGVFGLMPTMIVPATVAEWFSDMVFVEWPIAAREVVTRLARETDLVVALSHRGWGDDQLLAQQEPELALILGGHEHAWESDFRYAGHVPASYVGARGTHAALIGLDPEHPHEATRELIPLG
jgi:2',3'-cyclic-nucleotide 2'-phosphodiesterase (5'-nucleotidase family)